MTISQASLTSRVLGSTSSSLWLFLEKKKQQQKTKKKTFVIVLAPTFIDGFNITTQMLSMIISRLFNFLNFLGSIYKLDNQIFPLNKP